MRAAAPKPPLAIPPHSKLWGFLAFSREENIASIILGQEFQETRTSWSALAAKTRSASERPPMLWVQMVILTLPQVR